MSGERKAAAISLTFSAEAIDEDRVEEMADLIGDAMDWALEAGEEREDVIVGAIVALIVLMSDDEQMLH